MTEEDNLDESSWLSRKRAVTIGEDGEPTTEEFITYETVEGIEELHDLLVERINKYRAEDDSDGVVIDDRTSNQTLVYFTISSGEIEKQTARLITKTINYNIGGDFEGLNKFMKSMNQADREDLLEKMGLIDSGLKGELTKVRRRRNKLVHEPQSRHFETPHELVNDIKSVPRVLSRINDLHYELSKKGVDRWTSEFP